MKRFRNIISFCFAIVFIFIGLKYFDSKKVLYKHLADVNHDCYNHDYIYKVVGNGQCLISPDSKLIVFASSQGLKLLEVTTGNILQLSNSVDDIPGVWFSDSKRILGFIGPYPWSECDGPLFNNPHCLVPSNLRKLSVWDVVSRTQNTDLGVNTPELPYQIDWLVPDHTAKITSRATDGTEGDRYFYTLDLDKKTLVLTGDYHRQP